MQTNVEKSRGIISPISKVLGDFPATEAEKSVVVSITSDRGLCGGINTQVAKYTRMINKARAGWARDPRAALWRLNTRRMHR